MFIKREGKLGLLDVFGCSTLRGYNLDLSVFSIQVLFLPFFFLFQIASGIKTEKQHQGLLIELVATDGIKFK